MHFIDKHQVEQLLDMSGCIGAMAQTLEDYAAKRTVQVLRTAMPIVPGKILGVMPAANVAANIAGVKVITIFPENFKRGLPSHQGAVVLFDLESGALKAILDGEAITGTRTAAVSAAATDALARKDAHVLCLLGSGLQARRHLQAMKLVRDITEVRVWDISEQSVLRFKEDMEKEYGIPVINCCGNVEKAVSGADIICTVTAAKEPILFGAHVTPGAHINAVGACGAANRELDDQAVVNARFFCDSRESCMNEAGDFLFPLKSGLITEEHLLGEVGLVFSGDLAGRLSDSDITVFEAQGLAVEDLSAANYILTKLEG